MIEDFLSIRGHRAKGQRHILHVSSVSSLLVRLSGVEGVDITLLFSLCSSQESPLPPALSGGSGGPASRCLLRSPPPPWVTSGPCRRAPPRRPPPPRDSSSGTSPATGSTRLGSSTATWCRRPLARWKAPARIAERRDPIDCDKEREELEKL